MGAPRILDFSPDYSQDPYGIRQAASNFGGGIYDALTNRQLQDQLQGYVPGVNEPDYITKILMSNLPTEKKLLATEALQSRRSEALADQRLDKQYKHEQDLQSQRNEFTEGERAKLLLNASIAELEAAQKAYNDAITDQQRAAAQQQLNAARARYDSVLNAVSQGQGLSNLFTQPQLAGAGPAQPDIAPNANRPRINAPRTKQDYFDLIDTAKRQGKTDQQILNAFGEAAQDPDIYEHITGFRPEPTPEMKRQQSLKNAEKIKAMTNANLLVDNLIEDPFYGMEEEGQPVNLDDVMAGLESQGLSFDETTDFMSHKLDVDQLDEATRIRLFKQAQYEAQGNPRLTRAIFLQKVLELKRADRIRNEGRS